MLKYARLLAHNGLCGLRGPQTRIAPQSARWLQSAAATLPAENLPPAVLHREGRWSPLEESRLRMAIEKYGQPGLDMGNGSRLVKRRVRSRASTADGEPAAPKSAARKKLSWQTIADYIGTNRTASQVSIKWRRSAHPALKKGVFSPEEDEKISRGVEMYGMAWTLISQDVPGRSGRQIEQRYRRHIFGQVPSGERLRLARVAAARESSSSFVDPSLIRQHYSVSELQRTCTDYTVPLVAGVLLHGYRWPAISRESGLQMPPSSARTFLRSYLGESSELVTRMNQHVREQARDRRRAEANRLLDQGSADFAAVAESAAASTRTTNFLDDPALAADILDHVEKTAEARAHARWTVEKDLATLVLAHAWVRENSPQPVKAGKPVMLSASEEAIGNTFTRVFPRMSLAQILSKWRRCVNVFGTHSTNQLAAFCDAHQATLQRLFGPHALEESVADLVPVMSAFFAAPSGQTPQSVFSAANDEVIAQYIGRINGLAREINIHVTDGSMPALCLTREHLAGRYWQLLAARVRSTVESVIAASSSSASAATK